MSVCAKTGRIVLILRGGKKQPGEWQPQGDAPGLWLARGTARMVVRLADEGRRWQAVRADGPVPVRSSAGSAATGVALLRGREPVPGRSLGLGDGPKPGPGASKPGRSIKRCKQWAHPIKVRSLLSAARPGRKWAYGQNIPLCRWAVSGTGHNTGDCVGYCLPNFGCGLPRKEASRNGKASLRAVGK